MNRVAIIEERLRKAFNPHHLEVIDESHKHRGHVGAQGGAGHYALVITSDYLQQLSRVNAHREIYKVLQDLIPQEIHALSINLRSIT